MIKCEVRANCLGGKPMSALGELIEKRMKYLGETARYSVGAISINALKSVKTATKTYGGRGSAKVVRRG